MESPSDVFELEVGCTVSAPSRVREALSRIEGLGWVLGDATLIASELVTNALRHSGCTEAESIQVSVGRAEDRVLITVQDPGSSGKTARARLPSDIGAGGVGLWLVQQIARRWGAERNGGYRVWAELPLAAA